MMRAMWIFWSITISMMHSVQNGVCSWRKVGASLPHPSEEIEEFLPVFVHIEHLMGGISVKEEALAKQGEIPMQQEQDNDYHSA